MWARGDGLTCNAIILGSRPLALHIIGNAAYEHITLLRKKKTGKDEKISGSSARREGHSGTLKRTPLKSMLFSGASERYRTTRMRAAEGDEGLKAAGAWAKFD